MKFDEIDDALDIVKDTSNPIEIDNVKPIKCDKRILIVIMNILVVISIH